ncbi:hypothetical protein ACFYZ8_31895 [Streptomyces sp. NPDC001668]|uniref:hypothetical protein n=1 Tax=unclassified Streptomyces TaxID=2593676 RepID=UPI0036875609
MITNAASGRFPDLVRGRSERLWEPHTLQVRQGHLRSADAAEIRATRLVKDRAADVYGALRLFANRTQRGLASALLAAGNPVTPPLLDVVDQPGLPPGLITAWAPGDPFVPARRLQECDDLDALLTKGSRWTPAEALRTLVPLGRALDDMANKGFVPIELSPDHLVVNSDSVVLVGIGRHCYIPREGALPGPQGMSLPSALLLGSDVPSAATGQEARVRWREIQVRALTRLAGWMSCGLAPGAWGAVAGPSDLRAYLKAAGFQHVPELRPGQLADTLARAAADEEQARARADIADTQVLLVYDHAAQFRGGSPLMINPEALRLGLLHDHGPKVLALAAFESRRQGARVATLLSGAGWVLVRPTELVDRVRSALSSAPRARVVIVGRMSAADLRRIEQSWDGRVERVDPEDLSLAVPRIAGRPADQLPYLTDPALAQYSADLLEDPNVPAARRRPTGQAIRRRTFAGGWTLRLGDPERMNARERGNLLDRMADCFGTNTELLVAVRSLQNKRGMWRQNRLLDEPGMRRLVTALSGVPRSVFRDCLMSALLGPAADDLYEEAAHRLLPVAVRLTEVFDPHREIGADGLTMDDALRELAGIRRVGLHGRLCTAVPTVHPARLASAIAGMDDTLVSLLSRIPAPSLQFLTGRMEDPGLLDLLRPHLHGDDLDLLARYTPQMWRLLLDGLRQPEHLGVLGLGWAQVVAQDPPGAVDARVLLRIAAGAGSTGPAVVRTLLGTAPGDWPLVCAHPALAASWLGEQGDLEIAGVVAGFPDTETALARYGTDGLRNALELGLNQRAMSLIKDYADNIGHTTQAVLAAFQERGYERPEDTEPLGTEAAVAWSRWQLARGNELDWVLGNVISRPGRIREWAVEGPHLEDRVVTAVLGSRAASDRAAVLAADPNLLPLLADLRSAEQRASLLELYEVDPEGVLDPRARRELPLVLASADSSYALRTLLSEGLGVAAQQFADQYQLSPERRRLLAELTPLTERLAASSLQSLLDVGGRFGPRAAVTAAVVEQNLPGTAAVIAVWGPRWLPLLAGGSGESVLRLLVAHREKHGARAGRLTPWLLAAGEDGLSLVGNFGSKALDLVLATDASPTEARMLGELLTLPGSAQTMYRLVTDWGLPAAVWLEAARRLALGEQAERVLLHLWSRGPSA